MDKNSFETIAKIVDRADKMGLLVFDRMSLFMDLECAGKEFDMAFDDLLNADDYNFVHDVNGIQANLDRQTKTMQNCFVPRFAKEA